jgi:hypothetical protein
MSSTSTVTSAAEAAVPPLPGRSADYHTIRDHFHDPDRETHPSGAAAGARVGLGHGPRELAPSASEHHYHRFTGRTHIEGALVAWGRWRSGGRAQGLLLGICVLLLHKPDQLVTPAHAP